MENSASARRTLTVGCTSGLCNRLRVLISGLALAEARGRSFRMLWPRTPACAAGFGDLFSNPWPVEEAAMPAVSALDDYYASERPVPDFLLSEERHPTACTCGWMTDTRRFPAHRALLPRCLALLSSLQPRPEILDRVAEFRRRHFRSRMIGIHLRRGDMRLYQPEGIVPFGPAAAAVDGLLRRFPDAGILLSTDEPAAMPAVQDAVRGQDLRAKFRRRYGDKVVWTTLRSANRREPAAIQDALGDLWLLRSVDAFVGTEISSFSELAAYGRPIPIVWPKSGTPGYGFLKAACTVTGLYSLMRWDTRRRRRGQNVGLLPMLAHYRGAVRRRLS